MDEFDDPAAATKHQIALLSRDLVIAETQRNEAKVRVDVLESELATAKRKLQEVLNMVHMVVCGNLPPGTLK